MEAIKRPAARATTEPDIPELGLSCVPAHVLNLIRNDQANMLPTKFLNVMYALLDSIEKTIKTLKEKSRPAIVARRDEGKPTGPQNQHREFVYRIPVGEVHLTVQERIEPQPDLEILETLLKAKDLWQHASTTAIDMAKVNALLTAGLLTAPELANASNAPKITYALLAKINPKAQ